MKPPSNLDGASLQQLSSSKNCQKTPKPKSSQLKAQKCCFLSLYVEVYVLFDWLTVIPSGWWWYSVSLDPSVTPENSALPFLKPVCQCGKRQRNNAM